MVSWLSKHEFLAYLCPILDPDWIALLAISFATINIVTRAGFLRHQQELGIS